MLCINCQAAAAQQGGSRTAPARARLAGWRGLGQRGRLDVSREGAARYAPGMTGGHDERAAHALTYW
jgi:hypothetical protein